MSAYITLATPMIDEQTLVAAIVAEGFTEANIVCSESPVTLRGWRTGRQAHIVLRKEHTGDHYNDIGFLRSSTGFTAILSDDSAKFGTAWLAQVGARYTHLAAAKQAQLAAEERQRLEEERQRVVEAQRLAVHARAKKMGYQVQEAREGDKIRLMLVKRTY